MTEYPEIESLETKIFSKYRKVGSTDTYQLLLVANLDNSEGDYPTQVVCRRTQSNSIHSIPVDDWLINFEEIV